MSQTKAQLHRLTSTEMMQEKSVLEKKIRELKSQCQQYLVKSGCCERKERGQERKDI